MAAMLVGSSAVFARVVAVEDFETGTVGAYLTTDGWTGKTDTIDMTYYTFATSTSQDPNVHTGKVGDSNTYGGAIQKPFKTLSNITDNDSQIYVKYLCILQGVPILIAPQVGAGEYATVGPIASQAPSSQTNGLGNCWQVIKAANGAATFGDPVNFHASYEVLLQINFNKNDPNSTTGTLYYRTVGQNVWTVDSKLQNVNLGITKTTKPSTWGSWYVAVAMGSGAFDNLTIGTGDIHNCDLNLADLNGDCKVNLADFAIMAKQWMTKTN
jgi:hypothetical protein